MREILKYEQYNKYIAELTSIIEKTESLENDAKGGKISEKELEENIQNYLLNFTDIIRTILSYDLSEIPSDDLEFLIDFHSPENGFLDFSGTNANLDFSKLNYVENMKCFGCNVINLDQFNGIISPDCFDEPTKQKYQNLFLPKGVFSDRFEHRYYQKNLLISDLISLSDTELEILATKNWINRMQQCYIGYKEKNSNLIFILSPLIEKFGSKETLSLIKNHIDVFTMLENNSREILFDLWNKDDSYLWYYFSDKSDSDIEEYFYGAVKRYYTNRYDLSKPIDKGFESMGFKIIEPIKSISDLDNCSKSTIINNKNQQILIDFLGVDYIKKFEKETGYFTKHFNEIVNIFDIEEVNKVKEFPNSYEDFMNRLSILLNSIRKHSVRNQDSNSIRKQYDIVSHLFSDIPTEFKEKHQETFIDEKAPQELITAYYKNNIPLLLLVNNPEYKKYLEGKDFISALKNISLYSDSTYYNLFQEYYTRFGFNALFELISKYGYFLDKIRYSILFENGQIEDKDSINQAVRDAIYNKLIIDSGIGYEVLKEDQEFVLEHSDLFPNSSLPEELRQKFYKKEFLPQDFIDNPDLLEQFGLINIAAGFPQKYCWIIGIFTTNELKVKLAEAYDKIEDYGLCKLFIEYFTDKSITINSKVIDMASEVLNRIMTSNSKELFNFRIAIATEVLKMDDPLKTLQKIEDLFLKNHIPTIGKVYSCLEILHPDFEGFDFGEDSRISPVLKAANTRARKIIVFQDLIKATFGSNNRSVNEYLEYIEMGSQILNAIRSKQITYENLTPEQKEILATFRDYLATLYENTTEGKINNANFPRSEDVYSDIMSLVRLLSPDGTMDYKIEDRIIRMFCGFAGFDTLEQVKNYIRTKIQTADARNRKTAEEETILLQKGDLLKGLGENGIFFLADILHNGSVSKEYLGANADSDLTPLDTDLSIIENETGDNRKRMAETEAKGYGPIYFVLKNDDRFSITRTREGDTKVKRDLSKLELFYTGKIGAKHYGIRTGFASSEIDYIILAEDDPRVGLEIVLNGFYIPIVNMEGKVIFTPEDYKAIKDQLNGLSYYHKENEYKISQYLRSTEIEELQGQLPEEFEKNQINLKYLYTRLEAVLMRHDDIHKVQHGFNKDLSSGIAEIYQTGSTSRNTFVPGDNDYDYVIKVDKLIYNDLEKLKTIFKEVLGLTDDPSGKLVGQITGPSGNKLDVEISFKKRTDRVEYSTNASLDDYYNTIRTRFPDSYETVLANIILAKKMFKKELVYKSAKSDKTQGGLGGIGIENWILQHGGSLFDAARDFLKVAQECKFDFDEFKKVYHVWDFGFNHYESNYPHDDFVGGEDKMTASGFRTMVGVLQEYVKNYRETYIDDKDKGQSID